MIRIDRMMDAMNVGCDEDSVDERRNSEGDVGVLFPNTVLVMASDHLESWRIFPAGEGVDESLVEASLYTPEPAATDAARAEWSRRFAQMLGTVNEEDFPVVEDVQRGLVAGAQRCPLTFGRHEPALAHFHRAVAGELRVEAEEGI